MVVNNIIARIYGERNIELRSNVYPDIVGIEFQKVEIMNLLDIESDDVRFIGFHGMNGVGKTTLAGFIYDRIACKFEATSFIYCVSEETKSHGLVYLQKKNSF